MQAGLDLALLLVEADARITLLVGANADIAPGTLGGWLNVDSGGG